MKVKAIRSFWAHRDETFLELKEKEETEITDVEFLESLADMVTIVEYYPTVGDYKLLKEFDGHQVGETISLFGDQAGRLVLQGKVIPIDPLLWHPGRPLPNTVKSFMGRLRDAFVK